MKPGERSRTEPLLGATLVSALLVVPLISSNLTLLGGAIPYLGHALTADQGALPKMAALVALTTFAVLTWAWSQWHGRFAFVLPRTWPLLAALVVAVGLATIASVDPSTSFFGAPFRREGTVTLFSCVAFSVLVVQYVRSPERARSFAKATVWAGALIALYGLHQVAGIDPQNWGERIFEARREFATMGNPDLFAGYLVLIIPLGIGLAMTTKTPLAREAWWLVTTMMGIALLLSGVRGAWVGVAVALSVLAYSLTRSCARLYGFDVLTIVGGLFAALVAAVMTPHWTFGRLISVLSLAPLQTRAHIWASSIAATADRPLTGWGPDMFRYAWLQHASPAYVAAYSAEGIVDNAHDYYLQLSVTLGVAGALLFIAIIVVTLFESRAVLCADSDDRRLVSAWWASVLGYSVFLLTGLVDVASLVILWCALGVLAASQARPLKPHPFVTRTVASVACVLAIATTGLVGALVYADHAASDGLAAGEYQTRLAGFETAVRRAPWDHMYRVSLGDVLSGRAVLMASMQAARPTEKTVEDAGELTGRAVASYRRALADVERESRACVGIARTYRSTEKSAGISYANRIAALSMRYGRYAPYEPTVQEWYLPALAQAGRWSHVDAAVAKYRLVDPASQAWLVRALVYTGREERARRLTKDLTEEYPYDLRVQALADVITLQ